VERDLGAVRPGHYTGGVFRVVATMRMHRAARRTLSCQAFALRAVGYKQSTVMKLVNAKSQLERRFVHIDGEYTNDEYTSGNERSLIWRELDAAFESILTDVVINSNHIESRQFLEDTGL